MSQFVIHSIHHLSIKQVDDASGIGGIVLGMGYHDYRRTLPVQLVEQLHHLHAILGVEITSRFIGKDDARLTHHGTGYRHSLLLTARELAEVSVSGYSVTFYLSPSSIL